MKRGISMKKRVFVTLLAFCLVAALCVVGAAAEDLPDAVANTITLDRNYTGNLTVASGQDVTLDLNGHTLTNDGSNHTIVVEAGGILTVVDGSAAKTGKVDNINHGKAALVNYGTAYLRGGTFDRSHEAGTLKPYSNGGNSYYTVENYGNMTIYDGVTVQQDGTANGGTTGYFSSLLHNGWQNGNNNTSKRDSVLVIEGGLFSGGLNTVKNDDYGDITINGGTFTNIAQAAMLNWNVAEINGGDFTLNEGTAVSVVLNGYINDSIDKGQLTITGGNFNGNGGDAICTMDNGSSGIGTVEISGGDFTGDINILNVGTADSSVTISGTAKITGNVNNASAKNTLNIEGVTITGNVESTAGSVTVTDSTVTGTVSESAVVINSSVAGQPASDSVPDNVVAVIGGQHFESLEKAIEAANDGDTITLVDDVITDATVIIPDDKALTIVGNGNSIEINHDAGSDTHEKALTLLAPLTLDGVNLTINGYTEGEGHTGDGIQIGANTSDDATLTIQNGSTVTLNGVNNAMVMPGGAGAVVTVSGSQFNLSDIGGNGSNGGTYVFENADVNVNGCASYGFSVYSMTTRGNTTIDISGTGYSAIYGHSTLDFGGNTIVNVDNCGPTVVGDGNQWGYRDAPIQLRRGPEGAESITIGENAVINITNCTDNAGNPINNIYVVAGTTYTNNGGTVNANVVMADAPEGQYSVALVNNGVTLDSRYVDPNYSYSLPNLADRGGSTFAGWRVNGGSVVRGGTVYTITRNTVFTAVWDLIEIPDTYEINVSAGANGEASTSLTNASAGSTVTITATPDEGYRVGAVTVSGPDGRVEVTRVNATTYTFVMPAGGVEIDVSFVEDAALSEPFTDVSEGHWFYEYVAYVYTHGLMEGTSATTFEPDAGMTRAMFWAVLARIDGQSVSGANWLETARAWAMAEGVSDGTAASELVTREQMVTMLYRFAGSPVAGGMALSEFADAGSVSSWASDAMSWALGEGVISGMGGGMLSPQGTATRAQAAAILMRFVEG